MADVDVDTAALHASGSGAADVATTLPGLAMWLWMVATGIVLWRRAPAADA
jgi:hypothetical protein